MTDYFVKSLLEVRSEDTQKQKVIKLSVKTFILLYCLGTSLYSSFVLVVITYRFKDFACSALSETMGGCNYYSLPNDAYCNNKVPLFCNYTRNVNFSTPYTPLLRSIT